MSLSDKYRPKCLDEMIGNKNIISSIASLADNDELPHSILFSGPHGCGKTTLGRIIATILGASQVGELYEYDTAHFRGIDMIRDIRKHTRFAPKGGKAKVWLLDEVHKMTNDAQNALLKVLEEPPKHVYFILCTTNPEKLLPTVRSRCIHWNVEIINPHILTRFLYRVVRKEKKKVPKETLSLIAENSQGHVRDALSILEQVLHLPEEEMENAAERVVFEKSESIELCRALIKRKSWGEVTKILNGLKNTPPEEIRRHVMGYCDSVLSKTQDANAYLVLSTFAERNTYDIGFYALRLASYECIGDID